MRILLINPSTRTYRKGLSVKAQAPLGLLCLASVLREQGHKVKIFDHNVENNGIKNCKIFHPDLVGVSTFTGPMIRDALRLSEIFRELNVPILWGGVHASLLPIQTVSDHRVDMCVVGEGEETIVELADYLEKNRDISEVKGLVWKQSRNGGVKIINNAPRPFIKNLDALPFPAWDLIDRHKYMDTSLGVETSSLALYSIQSSRGCPYHCGFCYNTVFNECKWRFKSAARVLEEINFLKEKYNIKRLNFKDDNFVVNKKRTIKICKNLYRENIDVNFAIDCRVNLLSKELATYLKLGGCTRLFFGVESGSPRILRFIKKGITPRQAVNAVNLCRKTGLITSASFVIGFPTETLRDIELTQRFIYRLNPHNLLLKIFVPYPGSYLYDYVVKNNLFVPPQKLEDWALTWSTANYQLSEVPPEVLNRLANKIFLSFYSRNLPGIIVNLIKGVLMNKISIHTALHQGLQTVLAN